MFLFILYATIFLLQKRLPQHALGSAMIESAQQMEPSVLGYVL